MDKETILTYDLLAQEYDAETADFWEKFPDDIIHNFVSAVGQGCVLDLGSGPGRDGLILQRSGLQIVCVDASSAMVQITKNKGLTSTQAEFHHLPFAEKSFRGVWAYTSLIHLPKYQLVTALIETKRVLKPKGILGLGVIEGNSEGYSTSAGVNRPRYFAYYEKEEIEKLLDALDLRMFFFDQFKPKNRNYLNFLARNN